MRQKRRLNRRGGRRAPVLHVRYRLPARRGARRQEGRRRVAVPVGGGASLRRERAPVRALTRLHFGLHHARIRACPRTDDPMQAGRRPRGSRLEARCLSTRDRLLPALIGRHRLGCRHRGEAGRGSGSDDPVWVADQPYRQRRARVRLFRPSLRGPFCKEPAPRNRLEERRSTPPFRKRYSSRRCRFHAKRRGCRADRDDRVFSNRGVSIVDVMRPNSEERGSVGGRGPRPL